MTPQRLGYSIAGDPEAPRTAVYLHGAVLGSTMWHAQRDAIPDQRQVFVDLPGTGASRHLRWRSMTDSARLVLRVIDEVSPDAPVDLVGVSLGGDLGVRVITEGSARIHRAVLSGMISRPQRPWGEVRSAWAHVPHLRSPKLLTLYADHNGLPRADRDRLLRDSRTMRRLDFARTLRDVYRGMDLEPLRWLDTPILAVCGETEHLVAAESVRDLVRAGPSVTGVLTEGLGHSWHSEDPARFAAITTGWLTDGRLADGLRRIT